MVVSAFIEIIVGHLNPELHNVYIRGASLPRYILSSLFCNEIWFLSAAPPINGPLWSLSFEFWYYLIFGLWFYRKKEWKSTALFLLACIIAGPKILLMMPIWLAGYIAYTLPRPVMSVTKQWILVFAAFSISLILVNTLPVLPYGIGNSFLSMAGGFISDWATGIFVAIALWLLPTATHVKKIPVWAIKFRIIADLTFPIYVLHHPLLILWRALFKYQAGNPAQLWLAIICVLIISACIGFVLEHQRKIWVRFLSGYLPKQKNSLRG